MRRVTSIAHGSPQYKGRRRRIYYDFIAGSFNAYNTKYTILQYYYYYSRRRLFLGKVTFCRFRNHFHFFSFSPPTFLSRQHRLSTFSRVNPPDYAELRARIYLPSARVRFLANFCRRKHFHAVALLSRVRSARTAMIVVCTSAKIGYENEIKMLSSPRSREKKRFRPREKQQQQQQRYAFLR